MKMTGIEPLAPPPGTTAAEPGLQTLDRWPLTAMMPPGRRHGFLG